ncbi:sulfite exporter TauE/SafE family protein [Kistimonas asteriae]|uniref:sulfite exporter TauE/SafE family protein n=1 Tax=Kistimonas asteriae TaxID=517724 RepID=UPI001BAAB2E8|nr:sulfite exporter TauE/SafE family protein [Kistimonas asteriae]
MPETLQYTTAIILGLLGGAHCIGMCGGIMSALTLSTPASNTLPRRLSLLLAYNSGRIISYAIAGFLMGTLGWFLGGFSRETSLAIRWLAGLMLIAMGLYLSGWWLGLTKLEQVGHRLWRHIQPRAAAMLPITTPPQAFAVGMLWGWLPCGLVYSTLIWAASSASSWNAALLMLCFGIGTIPVLLATGLLADQMKGVLQHRGVRASAGMLVMLFGLWTIPGPHQHWVMTHLQLGGSQHSAAQPHGNSDPVHP